LLVGHRTDITNHYCVTNSPAEALGGKRFDEEGLLVRPNKGIVELRKELLALKGMIFGRASVGGFLGAAQSGRLVRIPKLLQATHTNCGQKRPKHDRQTNKLQAFDRKRQG